MTALQQGQRFKVVVDVHLVLRDGDRILLGERINTGFGDGAHHPPAGHMEPGESAVDAVVREAKEEVGISIQPRDVRLVHVMHNSSSGGRIAFFFEVQRWDGEPANMEKEKCAGWQWHPLRRLPENMIPYARRALASYADNEVFTLYGW